MMHDGGWFGMGGIGLYWQVCILILVAGIVAWLFVRKRSAGGR
jgi:hypothetical protein